MYDVDLSDSELYEDDLRCWQDDEQQQYEDDCRERVADVREQLK